MSIDRVKKSYVVRTSLFAFAIVVLVLGWSITPAQAGHCKGQHKDDPGCDRGGDGETPMIVTIEVHWGGDIIESRDPRRTCVAQQVHSLGDYGVYACELDPPGTNEVSYNLGVGVQTRRKGDAELCEVFDARAIRSLHQNRRMVRVQ